MAQPVTAYKDNEGNLYPTELEADMANAKEQLFKALIHDNDARRSSHTFIDFVNDWPISAKVYVDEILRIKGLD